MNQKQRMHYFTKLWPAACAAQGWDKLNIAQREAKRRAVTLQATGKESTTGLKQWDITRLFDHLKFLADDSNLNKAKPVANPEIGREEHERRRLVYAINHCGFTVIYLSRLAEAEMRAHRTDDWTCLPLPVLKRLVITVKERARARDAKATLHNPYAGRDPLPDAVASAILTRKQVDEDMDEVPF